MGLRRRLSKKWNETVNGVLSGPGVDVDSVNTGKAEITNVSASMAIENAQTISSGTETKVQWDSIKFQDSVADADTSDHTITVTEDGIYMISVGVLWSFDSNWSTGDQARTRIYVNGSFQNQLWMIKTSQSRESTVITDILSLSAGDTVDVRVIQESGSSIDIEGFDGFFSVGRLG